MDNSKKRPKLDIPANSIADMIEQKPIKSVVVTLEFDTPNTVVGDSYTSHYYNVLHDGEKMTFTAYTGLHNAIEATGAKRGDTIKITRVGETKNDTRYTVDMLNRVSSEGEAVPDGFKPSPGSKWPTKPAPPARQQSNNLVAEPMSDEELGVRLKIGEQSLLAIHKFASLVETMNWGDISPDQRVRLAISAWIHSDRIYRPGMTFNGESDGADLFVGGPEDYEAFEVILSRVRRENKGVETPDAVVTALGAWFEFETPVVIDMMKALGVKREFLLGDDDAAIGKVFFAFGDYVNGEDPEEAAIMYGLGEITPPQPPAW